MANAKAVHTPTPWRYFKQGDGTRFHLTARTSDKPGNSFDDFGQIDIQHEANAAHIVRCVNAHDQLIEALQALVDDDADALKDATTLLARLQA